MDRLEYIFHDYIWQVIIAFLPTLVAYLWSIIQKKRLQKQVWICVGLFAVIVLLVLVIYVPETPDTQDVPGPQDTIQEFVNGVEVSVVAGNGTMETNTLSIGDTIPIHDIRFCGLGSISNDSSTLYAQDNSRLFALSGEDASVLDSFYGEGDYEIRIVHAKEQDTYFLTEVWQEERDSSEDGPYTALMMSFGRIRDGGCELLGAEPFEVGYIDLETRKNKEMTNVVDFAISSNHSIWFLEQYTHLGDEGIVTLERLPYDSETDSYGYQENWFTIPNVTCADMEDAHIAFDKWDNLYISMPNCKEIMVVPSDVIQSTAYQEECFVFAGEDWNADETHKYIDGENPVFYHPTALSCWENYLYIWDRSAVRRITVGGADKRLPTCEYCETLAGVFHDNLDSQKKPGPASGSGNTVIFAASDEASLTVREDGHVFLSESNSEDNYIYLLSVLGE